MHFENVGWIGRSEWSDSIRDLEVHGFVVKRGGDVVRVQLIADNPVDLVERPFLILTMTCRYLGSAGNGILRRIELILENTSILSHCLWAWVCKIFPGCIEADPASSSLYGKSWMS